MKTLIFVLVIWAGSRDNAQPVPIGTFSGNEAEINCVEAAQKANAIRNDSFYAPRAMCILVERPWSWGSPGGRMGTP